MSTKDKLVMGHTPEPWVSSNWEPGKINGLPAGGIAIHADWTNADGYALLIATIQPGWSNSAHEANARLIAAAPELLAACRAILAPISTSEQLEAIRGQVRLAIERAEGGSK